MKTWIKIGLGIVAAVLLVVIGLGGGWLLWGRRLWMAGGWGPGCVQQDGSAWNRRGWGPGMMGGWDVPAGSGYPDCPMSGAYVPSTETALTIEQAQEAVEAYIDRWGNDLEVAELMEFDDNFYALVRETDTGVGAMELLVDKTTGAVGPEMGPNMMWNARYGMHGRGGMMRWSDEEKRITGQEAVEMAQAWLDENKPGVTTEGHADPFYGYYTVHTERDGRIEGMLSVHGDTGQVWYHTWHGDFIQMVELDEAN